MSDGRKSGLAIFSLVLGILSILVLGFLAAIPGIIIGHIARSKAKNNSDVYSGGGVALAGLILSYLGLILSIGAIWFMMTNPDFLEALQNIQKQAVPAQ